MCNYEHDSNPNQMNMMNQIRIRMMIVKTLLLMMTIMR